MINLFWATEVITCSKVINAFKRQSSWTDPFRKSSIWDFYSMDMDRYEVLQAECVMVKYKATRLSTSYAYVTSEG